MQLPRTRAYIRKKDIDGLTRTLQGYVNFLLKAQDYPGRLSEIGINYAKSIAPVDTGTLIKSIMWKTTKKWGAEIVIDKSTLNSNPKNKTGRSKNFNYANYMHFSPDAQGKNWHGKDNRFMFTTRDYLWRELQQKVGFDLRKETRR